MLSAAVQSWTFLCRVCMFSLCLHVFSTGSSAPALPVKKKKYETCRRQKVRLNKEFNSSWELIYTSALVDVALWCSFGRLQILTSDCMRLPDVKTVGLDSQNITSLFFFFFCCTALVSVGGGGSRRCSRQPCTDTGTVAKCKAASVRHPEGHITFHQRICLKRVTSAVLSLSASFSVSSVFSVN